ncbi:MAG: hypothetical protein LBK52_00250 [Deltaproteobacteria bacterium]|nr:hypothetical protein [Deltaproteobacteria bacterium]
MEMSEGSGKGKWKWEKGEGEEKGKRKREKGEGKGKWKWKWEKGEGKGKGKWKWEKGEVEETGKWKDGKMERWKERNGNGEKGQLPERVRAEESSAEEPAGKNLSRSPRLLKSYQAVFRTAGKGSDREKGTEGRPPPD